jgi:hypothetical protein
MIPRVYIILIAVVLAIMVPLMIYTSYFTDYNSPLERFVGKFSTIASVFIPLGIFLTFIIFKNQYDALARDSTFKIIDRGWLDVNKKLVEYYDKCPNFIESLYFDWQKREMTNCASSNRNLKKCDDWYVINNLSIHIFQAWEDFITSTQIDQTGYEVWMNNFLQWSNSKYLRKSWSVLKGNFAKTTREFGDYLFDISKNNKPKSELELYNLANKVANSSELKTIINKRFT